MMIDSHTHLWVNDPQAYPWQPIGGYVPDTEAPLSRYLAVMERNHVDGAVLVQPTPYGWDNAYLFACQNEDPHKLKAVVLVDPFSQNAAERYLELFEQGAVGLRINLHLNPLSTWNHPHFHQLLAQCVSLASPVCLQITPEYLPLVNDLSSQYPTDFIIDHLGRPSPGCSQDHPDFQSLLSLSKHPNIYIKLSGMNYYSNQSAPYPDTWDLLRAAHESFGADHCLWGSDYPFIEDHWSYSENLSFIQAQLGFSQEDLAWVMGKTAQSLWWRR